MKNITRSDYEFSMRACQSEKATEEEKNLLSFIASMFMANEKVSATDYRKMSFLTGSLLGGDNIFYR